MDTAMAGWLLLALGWGALAIYVTSLVRRVWQDSLVRCPETNAVALIRLQRAAPDGGATGVERCNLWPQEQRCARGCLARRAIWPRVLAR